MSPSRPISPHHRIIIIGGGTAGITMAARLRRAGATDITLIEPSDKHYYQPLWTLVGGGVVDAGKTVRSEARLIPKGVRWIRDRAVDVDPQARTVTTETNGTIGYDQLVVATGLQLDFDKVPGLAESVGQHGIGSNYRLDLAGRTWEFIRDLRSGTALFTMPPGPIKCGGAPQKIAYLAADWWRRQGVLDRIRIVLVLPTPTIFGQPDFAKALEEVVADYGIEVRYKTHLVEVDGPSRRAVLLDTKTDTKETLEFDFMHVVPPQSAPDWLKATPLADPASPFGYVEVDKYTLQSQQWPEVFALGDAANVPTSKTGAAVRKQAPVVVANMLAAHRGEPPAARYNGYSSCPLVTSRTRMLLAEFDYDLKATPSIPLIDTKKPRYDMWLLKRYGLPALYWHLMLRGLA
ncbi:MAG TPA: FAD/NAD(P)-binding oxidoreductase [Micromonosporaceae bacterium]